MSSKNYKFSIFAFSILFILCSLSVRAQNEQKKKVSDSAKQTEIDKTFELNIKEDRIIETDFKRSTSVELKSSKDGGLSLEVGVSVSAERIDAVLRGIFGHVRFRSSLESLRQKIEQLQTPKEPE